MVKTFTFNKVVVLSTLILIPSFLVFTFAGEVSATPYAGGPIVSNISPIDTVNWKVNPWFVVFVSAISIFAGTVVVAYIVKVARRYFRGGNDKDVYHGDFWDIVRDGDYYPSLSRFQFVLWTIVISFVFLSIYLIRIDGGEYGFPNQIPNSILELMGISVAVPIVSNPLSSYKYDSALSVKPASKNKIPPLFSMLLEADKPVLFRYQMFLWTFIGIGIYLLLFFSVISATVLGEKVLKQLSIPDIDPSLVILMGLSQGGYLGGKLVARTPLRIVRVIKGSDNVLTILGENFGTGGIVLIDNEKIASSSSSGVLWSDTRIDVPLSQPEKLRSRSIVEIVTNESISTRFPSDEIDR